MRDSTGRLAMARRRSSIFFINCFISPPVEKLNTASLPGLFDTELVVFFPSDVAPVLLTEPVAKPLSHWPLLVWAIPALIIASFFTNHLLEKWDESRSERQDGFLFVLSDPYFCRPSADGGIDSLAEQEGALTLEATAIQNVDEAVEEVVRSVPVPKAENLGLFTGRDLFGDFLGFV